MLASGGPPRDGSPRQVRETAREHERVCLPVHDCRAPLRLGMRWGRACVCGRCGGQLKRRPDDRPEMVKKRLEVYSAETAPLIDYYTGMGKLVAVDGEASVAQVTGRIITALGRKEPVAG